MKPNIWLVSSEQPHAKGMTAVHAFLCNATMMYYNINWSIFCPLVTSLEVARVNSPAMKFLAVNDRVRAAPSSRRFQNGTAAIKPGSLSGSTGGVSLHSWWHKFTKEQRCQSSKGEETARGASAGQWVWVLIARMTLLMLNSTKRCYDMHLRVLCKTVRCWYKFMESSISNMLIHSDLSTSSPD